MDRLTIDLSPLQHRRLRALAALSGQSVQEYLLGCALDPVGDELEALLQARIEEAEARGPVDRSVEQIFREEIERQPPGGEAL